MSIFSKRGFTVGHPKLSLAPSPKSLVKTGVGYAVVKPVNSYTGGCIAIPTPSP